MDLRQQGLEMGDRTDKVSLAPIYLLIALGPPIVFVINQWLLQNFGLPHDFPPPEAAAFDVHSEGAARYSMLAALMLFVGAALAALGFFFYTLRMLELRARVTTFVVFVVLALAAVVVPALMDGKDGKTGYDYSGRSLACFAAGHGPANQAQKENGNRAVRAQPVTTIAIPQLGRGEACPYSRFETMRWLGDLQYFGVVFSFSALVLGAICCLAPRPGGSRGIGPATPPLSAEGPSHAPAPPVADETKPAPVEPDQPGYDPDLAHWEEQSGWLNTYLYLAALLLITALLFIHAYLRWPGFVLETRTGYDSHMAALVSYYGFTFTVMLASFYIPVATILSRKVKRRKNPAPGESKLPHAFAGPIQLLKIMLALFSSAFAGALPDILDKIV